jgi:hypothetical protein
VASGRHRCTVTIIARPVAATRRAGTCHLHRRVRVRR